MDGFVLLTPLVVLAVILLLGFTGCQLVFGLDPVSSQTMSLEVRLPSRYTVILSRFLWIRPGSTISESTTALVRTDEGPDVVVLSHIVTEVTSGSWRVTCRLQVQDGAQQAEDAAALDFMVQASPGANGVVRFETTGGPVTGDFRVVPVGFVPE